MLSRAAGAAHRGRPREWGAMAVLSLAATAMLGAGAMTAADAVAYIATDNHAMSAADAAAHAGEAAVLADPEAEALSIAAQAGQVSCEGLHDARCAAFVTAARVAADANGGRLLNLRIGPDLRDRKPGAGAGRLTTLAEVATPRRLALVPSCGHAPGDQSDLCWAITWSAAEQVTAGAAP